MALHEAAPLDARASGDTALERALRACVIESRRTGTPRVFSARAALAACDPLAAYAAWEPAGDRFYWEHPSSGLAIGARGAVATIETAGAGRIREAARRARALFRSTSVVGDAAPPIAGPLLVGGFAFEDAGGASPDVAFDARFDAGERVDPAAGEWRAYPPGRLVLPELLIVRAGQPTRAGGARAWCTASLEVVPGTDVADACRRLSSLLDEGRGFAWHVFRDAAADEIADPLAYAAAGDAYRVAGDRAHAVYRAQVARALEAVADGELEKVVLARSLEVTHPGRFGLAPFLDRLRGAYPSCATFSVARGAHAFVAASPERLVALGPGAGETRPPRRVETGALAGSAPRGRTPEEDERIGRALRESKKDQAEHATVVRAIRASLADVCGPLAGPESPGLLRVEGIQHLSTPLCGALHPARAATTGILELVDRLHPTPAVGGVPRRAALEWLRAHEGLTRGWYAGPIGFVDAHLGGEFFVGLRSALIRNPAPGVAGEAHARLFAGAGIVLGSDPELELRETRLKLRALLAPLTEI